TKELAVRMALGAQKTRIRWLVLREALAQAAIGVALGVPVAIMAARLIATLLYGVRSADGVTLLGAVAIMLAVAAVAAYLPARRACPVRNRLVGEEPRKHGAHAIGRQRDAGFACGVEHACNQSLGAVFHLIVDFRMVAEQAQRRQSCGHRQRIAAQRAGLV